MRNDTNNSIADALVIASDKVKYDANVRNILANKSILAWILKFATDEFKECDIEEIADCIENPEIGTLGVNPGYISSRTDDKENSGEHPDKITGMSNEDNVPNEGKIVYDIRFSVYKPGVTKDGKRDVIKLIINVEAQKNFYPGYNIVTRALFYCARMLSAQLGTEFNAQNYDNIKKVYSIWICMDTNTAASNTITSYEVQPRNIYGEYEFNGGYDLQRAVIICLGRKQIECYNKENDNGAVLLNLLNVLIDKKLTAEQKQTILKDNYSIEMTHKMREELSGMCNLSDLIEEEGLAKGRAQERYNLINNYMTRKNATLEEACDVIGISPEEYYEAEKLLKEQ